MTKNFKLWLDLVLKETQHSVPGALRFTHLNKNQDGCADVPTGQPFATLFLFQCLSAWIWEQADMELSRVCRLLSFFPSSPTPPQFRCCLKHTKIKNIIKKFRK